MGLKIEYSNDGKMFRYVETPYVKKDNKGKSIIDELKNYIVIDTETTGLDSDYNELIEIAAVKVSNGVIVDSFSSLIKPTKHYLIDDIRFETDEFLPISMTTGYYYVDNFISSLTGITNEMLEDAPELSDVLPKYKEFIGDSVLIGHNVNFDINFLYTAFQRTLSEPLTNDYSDTRRYSRKLFPEYNHHRLKDLSKYCGVEYKKAHRALEDCMITQQCYDRIITLINDRYTTFDEFQKLFKPKSYQYKPSEVVASTTSFDEDHPLFDKTVVFTGKLNIPRQEAMQLVVNVGGKVSNSITKSTNYLVVGSFDFVKAIKGDKSTKMIKAEKLKNEGKDIDIITENTFLELLEN